MTRQFWGPGDPRTLDPRTSAIQSYLDFTQLPSDAPDLLKDNTIYVRDPERILSVHTISRQRDLQNLIRRYIHQLTNGCGNQMCRTATCWTFMRQKKDPPARKFTILSARAMAYSLATRDDPYGSLCPNKQAITPELEDEAILRSKERSKSYFSSSKKDELIDQKKMDKDTSSTATETTRSSTLGAHYRSIESEKKQVVDEDPSFKPKKAASSPKKQKATRGKSQSKIDPRSITQNWYDTPSAQLLDKYYLSNDIRQSCDRFAPVGSELSYPTFSSLRSSGRPRSTRTNGKHRPKRSEKNRRIKSPESRRHPNVVLAADDRCRQGDDSKEGDSAAPPPDRPRTGTGILPISESRASINPKPGRRVSWGPSNIPPTTQPTAAPTEKVDRLYRPPETLRTLDCQLIMCSLAELERLDPLPFEAREYISKNNVEDPSLGTKQALPYQTMSAFLDQSIHYCLGNYGSLLQAFQSPCRCLISACLRKEQAYCRKDMDAALRPLLKARSSLVFRSLWIAIERLFDPPPDLNHSRSPRLRPTSNFNNDLKSEEKTLELDLNASRKSRFETNWNAFHAIVLGIQALAAFTPKVKTSLWLYFARKVSKGYFDASTFDRNNEKLHKALQGEERTDILALFDCLNDDMALRFAARLVRAFSAQVHYSDLLRARASQEEVARMELRSEALLDSIVEWLARTSEGEKENGNPYASVHIFNLSGVFLEWVKTLFLKHWTRDERIPRFSVAGSCLAILRLLHSRRRRLKIKSEAFTIPAVVPAIDAWGAAASWLKMKADTSTLHLIEYSFLFPDQMTTALYRSLNLRSMATAYESAKGLEGLLEKFKHIDPLEKGILQRHMQLSLEKVFVLNMRRSDMLDDTLNQLWQRQRSEVLKPLRILIDGEEGHDMGGVQQEFFQRNFAKILTEYEMFTRDSRSKKYWFQPCSFEPLHRFELVGLLLGLALYNGVTVPVSFPLAFYRKLLGLPVESIDHIDDGWPELAAGFKKLLTWPAKDVEQTFVRTFDFSFTLVERNIEVDMRRYGDGVPWPPAKGLFPDSKEEGQPSRTSSPNKMMDRSIIQSDNSHYPAASFSSASSGGVRLSLASDSRRNSVIETSPTRKERRKNRIEYRNPLQPSSLTPSDVVTLSRDPSELDTDDDLSDDEEFCPSDDSTMVTNVNRRPFVRSYIHWLTHKSIAPQWTAFTRGFFSIIDPEVLSLFSPETLRPTLEGLSRAITVEELKAAARYDNDPSGPDDPLSQRFWRVVERFTPKELQQLLMFVTSTDRVPIGGLRSIDFVLMRNGDDDDRLPSAGTCFGHLMLPDYSSDENMERKLKMAIRETEGFGLV